ncbi:MAG: TIR domain-containing protein [Chloroflexota bacterium]
MSEYYDDSSIEDEIIEGYCMRCRETVEIEAPKAVWTRRGMPATRGECPDCGGTVFRMGKTEAHDASRRPDAVDVAGEGRRKLPRLERDTVYVIFAEPDEAIARQIADDLNRVGLAAWIHEHDAEDVAWAGGVHPALRECNRMLYVLSPSSLADDSIKAGWQFFREQRKPIIIAQIGPADPPDAIRRSPRFDFRGEYKRAFREMMQALG